MPLISYFFVTADLLKKIPAAQSEILHKAYFSNLYKNVLISQELVRLLTAFNRQGIPVLSLKGIVLADQLYQNLGVRQVSDIDILVRPDDLAAASSILEKLDYTPMDTGETWNHPFHEVPFLRHGQLQFVVELHREIEDPALVTVPYSRLWERAQMYKIQNASTLIFSAEDNLLYLSNNLGKQKQEALKYLCDIRRLLEKHRGSLDWDYIIESAGSWGIKTAVFVALKRCMDIFAEKVPDRVLSALKPGCLQLKVMDFLVAQEYLLFSLGSEKIKEETLTFFKGILTGRYSRMMRVLSRYRGAQKMSWFKTLFWAVMVLMFACARNLARIFRFRSHLSR